MKEVRMVLLDRDGVINRKAPEGGYVRSSEELEILPGVPEAIRLLNVSGILAVVITNQRGIALRQLTERDLEAIHASLASRLAEASAHLDAIYHCPHDYDQCDCRKPKTGMLERALREFPAASRDNTILIGDSASDIAAGKAFGIPTILISIDEGAARNKSVKDGISADANAASLLEAVELFVNPSRETCVP
jgi:D-glycero-D-manno-heptose 1,7-bisphosphate phosphatase